MKPSRIAVLAALVFALVILLASGIFFRVQRSGTQAPRDESHVSLTANKTSPEGHPSPAASAYPTGVASAPGSVSTPATLSNLPPSHPASPTVATAADPSAPATAQPPSQAGRPAVSPMLGAASVPNYRDLLAPEFQEKLDAFVSGFPGKDPTDVDDLQDVFMAERGKLGRVLDDASAESLSALMREWEALQAAAVSKRAEVEGLPIERASSTGGQETLVGFREGEPVYIGTQNVSAAISTNAARVRMTPSFDPLLGDSVSGSGLYVNVNDHGTIYDENPEFQLPNNGGTRVVFKEVYDAGDRSHMTHCAGTVGAWGYDPLLTGMAPRVWIRSIIQQSTSDVTTHGMRYPGQLHTSINPRTGEPEMRSVMGTTSLGSDPAGPSYGYYSSTTRTFDQVLWDYPYYIHFYAAGNNGGLSTLSEGQILSKNVITISAATDVIRDANGNSTGGGSLAGFSSQGPAFDGRIKPDFAANGVSVLSPSSDTGSSSKQGTSMATPNASGTTVLLIDYFHKKFPGHFLRSSTLKALLANTADDRGDAGPDYSYGWGIVNVEAAAKIVKTYAQNPSSRVVMEDALAQGQTWTAPYTYSGSGPVRVTLAWIDPPTATTQLSNTTDRTPRLVNNLNLRLIAPDGTTTHMPFVMPFTTGQGATPAYDDSLRGTPAVTGDNVTDNCEQILVSAPQAGTYTIQISHTGTLLDGAAQKFSLAVTGLAQSAPLAASVTSVTPAEIEPLGEHQLTVSGSGFVLGSDVILRRSGVPDLPATAVEITGSAINCRLDGNSAPPGKYDLVVRSPDGSEAVLPGGFLVLGNVEILYSNGFNSASHGVTLQGSWTVAAPAYDSWLTIVPQTAYEGTGILGTALTGQGYYANNADISARLPAINATGKSALRLSFQRWLRLTTGDAATIEVSTDGSSWTTVWSAYSFFLGDSWNAVSLDLPASLDNQPTVYIRFRLQSDANYQERGWHIDDLRITAQSASKKQPPAFTSTPITTGTLSQAYSYAVTTSDADTAAAALTFSATGLPPGLSLTQNGAGGALLAGTPTAHGSYTVRLSVSDGNYSTYQEFQLFINPAGGNAAPVITTATLPNAYISEAYSTMVAVTDANSHITTLTASGVPNWLTFTDNGNNTATLAGTPPPGSNLVYPITFTATDGAATVQKTLNLTVGQRAVVGLTTTSASVAESAGSVSFTVSRTIGSSGVVTVDYATTAGTATAPSDFTATNGTLTWADGDMADKTITIPITADNTREMTESFTLALSNLTGVADMASTSATITVTDDDVPPGQAITLGPLYLLEHGSVAESGGVRTLTRTGTNVFQGYAGNLPALPNGGELTEIGDFIELVFTIKPNTANNTARRVSWGFFNGAAPVTADAERAVTDTWTGLIHQLGTRTSSTTGAAAMRQGNGTVSLMDHVGGTTTVNGTSTSPSVSSLDQTKENLVRARVERINATQVRMVSTFPTGSSAGSSSGSTGSGNTLISWSYTTAGGSCEFRSVHNIAAGPSPAIFNGFAIASQGDLWTLGDLSASSNIGQSLQPAAPVISSHPQSQSVEIGGTIELSVTATGNPSPTYQWRKGGSNIGGATSPGLSIPNAQPGDAGSYDVVVTNTQGNATSNPAVVTVTSPNTAPTISSVSDQTIVANQSTSALAFTIDDAQTPVGNLVVSAESSNTTLLPSGGIALGGTNGNRTVTLTPSAGQTGSALVTLTVDDGSLTSSTSFTLTVTAAPNPGTIGFGNATFSCGENEGSVTVTVRRTGGTSGNVTVTYGTSNGTASAASDYAVAGGTLAWSDGDAADKQFAIAITNDGIEEPNETFSVNLSNPTGGASLGTDSATVTIYNDDDNTPPVNAAGWPKADTVTATGFTIRTQTNESGTAYYVVLADGAAAPTSAQVKAGAGAMKSGSILLAANTEGASAVTGLQPATAYDVYVVAQDSTINLQAVAAKVDVTTSSNELIAHWRMNEGNGTTAADSSGNSRNATLGSGVSWNATGKSGAALSFNGTNTTNNRANFTAPANPTRLVTVAGWVKVTALASGSYPRLVSTPAFEFLVVGSGVSGNTNCVSFTHVRSSATDSWRTPTNSFPVGEWVHLAAVFDASNTANTPVIYLNGVPASLTKTNNGSGAVLAFDGASYLGNRAAGDRALNGLLDEWRIHYRLLDATEITGLQTAGYGDWIATQSGTGGLTGATDDPDGDGVPNLLEYALGGGVGGHDASRLPVAGTYTPGPGEEYLSLTINRDPAVQDVNFIVEVSGDLTTWTSGPAATTVLSETAGTLVVRDNTPIGNGRRFIRLRVVANQ